MSKTIGYILPKPTPAPQEKPAAPKAARKKRMPNKRRPMTDFNFYSETYCGSLIPADAWDAVCRDAEAQMNRYERIYHVSYPQTGSRNMAVCAMAEALYEFAQLQDAGGAVQSVSVGNVSENRAAVAAPDTSAAAQAAELYRRAGLYADIYRGAEMQRYFARDQTLTYPLCTMTVTVYHTTFNPFECRRAVLEGVHYETRRTVAVDKTGAAHSAGYLLIIPQKTAARVSPTVDTGMDGTYVLQPGDRVVAGEGPEITTREEWAALLPSDYDVTTVTWVEQKYWHGQPCHVEAGA